eukprot:m.249154 g.249154  ORF g.249154 m.249154 type:complete len:1152 (-) comp22621_c0_seq1:36-3491(-)
MIPIFVLPGKPEVGRIIIEKKPLNFVAYATPAMATESEVKHDSPDGLTVLEPQEAEMYDFKSMTCEQVYKIVQSSPAGLTSAEAQLRRERDGPNALPPPKTKSLLRRIWDQINNTLIYILLVAGAIKIGFGSYIDSSFIFLVVLLNIVISILQEGKAETAARSIANMLAPSATVLRDGKPSSVNADGLVVGDVVKLKAGDKVPADIRVTRSNELQTQEAMLTGESAPMSKISDPMPEDTPLAETKSMVFSGCLVVNGEGTGVVVGVGEDTEIGRINKSMSATERPRTPLLVQLDTFGRWLSVVVLVLALATFLVDYLVRDTDLKDSFGEAVSVAVAIIPEGLPSVVTVTLAIAVATMSHHSAIVKSLPAVETLGCVSVICSDKTGTLTKNQMSATRVYTAAGEHLVEGTGYNPADGRVLASDAAADTPEASQTAAIGPGHPEQPRLLQLLQGAVLCSSTHLEQKPDKSWAPVGSPTEGALVCLYKKLQGEGEADPDSVPVYTLQFKSEYKFMAMVHDLPDPSGALQRVAFVKGATEVLINLCKHQARGGNPFEQEPVQREEWLRMAKLYSGQGMRVLALCRAVLPAGTEKVTAEEFLEQQWDLQVDAIVAIADPPRPEAIEAVESLHSAGIEVKMITGDSVLTARSIGEQLGLHNPHLAVSGAEMDKMTEQDLFNTVLNCNIYARMTPDHKVRIVRSLLHHHKITAMTGDGVNDSVALKLASIGIGMGSGTEIAKESSVMVLADDNFATIETAVCQGRTVYANIIKILAFTLGTNFAQGLSVSIAVFVGLQPPLEALQVLYINMITSVTMGGVLSLEDPELDIMERRPRSSRKPLLGKWLIWRIFLSSSIIIGSVLGNMEWHKSETDNVDEQRSVAFATLIFCQCGYIYNCRYLRYSSLTWDTLTTNMWINGAVVLNIALLCLLIYTPGLNDIMNLTSFPWDAWLRCVMFAVIIFFLIELDKFVGPHVIRLANPLIDLVRSSCDCFRSASEEYETPDDVDGDGDSHGHGDSHGVGSNEGEGEGNNAGESAREPSQHASGDPRLAALQPVTGGLLPLHHQHHHHHRSQHSSRSHASVGAASPRSVRSLRSHVSTPYHSDNEEDDDDIVPVHWEAHPAFLGARSHVSRNAERRSLSRSSSNARARGNTKVSLV